MLRQPDTDAYDTDTESSAELSFRSAFCSRLFGGGLSISGYLVIGVYFRGCWIGGGVGGLIFGTVIADRAPCNLSLVLPATSCGFWTVLPYVVESISLVKPPLMFVSYDFRTGIYL